MTSFLRAFHVQATYDYVVIASSEEEANRIGAMVNSDSPTRITAVCLERGDGLPPGWTGVEIPWGLQDYRNPDKTVLDWLGQPVAPTFVFVREVPDPPPGVQVITDDDDTSREAGRRGPSASHKGNEKGNRRNAKRAKPHRG